MRSRPPPWPPDPDPSLPSRAPPSGLNTSHAPSSNSSGHRPPRGPREQVQPRPSPSRCSSLGPRPPPRLPRPRPGGRTRAPVQGGRLVPLGVRSAVPAPPGAPSPPSRHGACGAPPGPGPQVGAWGPGRASPSLGCGVRDGDLGCGVRVGGERRGGPGRAPPPPAGRSRFPSRRRPHARTRPRPRGDPVRARNFS